jgi:hypothetical protein
LLPYYYCTPASPFEVDEYIKRFFPDILCHDTQYDVAAHERLAICYLSDHGLWEDAIERFAQSKVTVQTGIYDYLFRQLLRAKKQNDARAISVTFLENIEGGRGLVDQGQVDVVRFYLIDFHILNFTALSVVGVLQYSLLPLAL